MFDRQSTCSNKESCTNAIGMAKSSSTAVQELQHGSQGRTCMRQACYQHIDDSCSLVMPAMDEGMAVHLPMRA